MEVMTKGKKIRNIILLFLTALIWGMAFVAQSVSMDYIQPLTFICIRFFIGGLFLLPFIFIMDKKKKEDMQQIEKTEPNKKTLLAGGIICGIFLFGGSFFQQVGIQYTTVGKAGFLTAFYIIIVPLLGLFLKKKCPPLTWCGVALSLVGLYFLCMTESLTLQKGDALVFIGAFMFAGQIMAIDYYNPMVDGVRLSCIQFFTAGIIGFIGMILFEQPQLSAILGAAGPILYTGIMSSGVGYTLQIIGQKGIHPALAALILSLESVFSALSGFLFLHQGMSGRELLGCGLMFLAIILAQMPDFREKRY